MGEPRGRKSLPIPKWVKTFLAPLLVVSLGLHALLLLTPVPSQPEQESPAEEETEDSDSVDLLSISQLATQEAELPPEPLLPEPQAPPLEAPVMAQPPVPAVALEPPPAEPEALDQPDVPPEAPPAPDPTVAPDAAPQTRSPLATRLSRGAGESNFDVTETLFPVGAWPVIGQWSGAEQACFFAAISENSYQLQAGAADIRFLTRNIELVEREDLLRTFPSPEFQLNRLENGYCNRTFYEVLQGGQPVMFISVIGIGPGNPQSTALVVFWTADPRLAGR